MSKRHTETDLLRLIASFAVGLLHVAAQRMSAGTPAEAGAWLPCLLNALCRFAVPVFIMISGRYMLAGECSVSRGLSKAGRTLLSMLLWSAVYLGYALCTGWRPGGSMELLTRLLTEPVHLWYFWAAAALYACTPILSVFTCHASREQLLYAIGLTGFLGCGVTILLRTGRFPLLGAVMEQTKLPYATGFLCCYLLGYYLTRYPLEKKGRGILALLGLGGAALTFGGTMWLSLRAGAWNDLLMSFFAPNVVAAAAAVFALVNHWAAARSFSERSRWLLGVAAGTTAGIYGLHMLALWLLPGDGLPMVAQALLVYAASGLVIWLLQRLLSLVRK